jgi:hypothetical protein
MRLQSNELNFEGQNLRNGITEKKLKIRHISCNKTQKRASM